MADQVVSFRQPSILLLRYYLFESFVVVSLFPIESSVTGTNSTSKKVLAATAKSVKNVPKFVSLETKLHLERRGEPVIICQRLQSTTLL